MEPDLINEILPGDEQYQGIAPLLNEPLFVPTGGGNFPIKKIVTNTAKNLAQDYILKKAGIDGVAGNILGAIGTGGIMGLNPLALATVGSTLPNPVKGIAEYLRNKRIQKQIDRTNTMTDAANITNRLKATQPTDRDIGMGGGSIPTQTATPTAPAPRAARHTAGVGGLHSGYK